MNEKIVIIIMDETFKIKSRVFKKKNFQKWYTCDK